MAVVVEPEDANFHTKLSEASLQRAQDELGENESERNNEVQSLRHLVLHEEWLKTPTEFSFLLRFLRARKHSQLCALETLENFWTIRTKYPEWFGNIDPADDKLQEILRTGFYFSPNKCDSQGRRILIDKIGNLDVDIVKEKYGIDNIYRAMILVCDWINIDENVHVNGIQVFIDMSNMTMKHHLHLMNFDNMKKIFQYYQMSAHGRLLLHRAWNKSVNKCYRQRAETKHEGRTSFHIFSSPEPKAHKRSLPARMKKLHIYSEPHFFDALFQLFKPLMKQKMVDRMILHGKTLTGVYGHIEESILPTEYLPDDYTGPSAGTTNQCVEEMIADMLRPEFRNYMKDLSSSKYGVDLEKRKQTAPTDASFRKLNID